MAICEICAGDLTVNEFTCSRCGFPLPSVRDGDQTICGRCMSSRITFDRTISPYLYTYPADYIVHALKFSGHQKYARLMGDLMARTIVEQPDRNLPQLLLPVPLHRMRFRERGFNQSTLIARYCGKHLDIPVVPDILQRIVNTAPQAELSKAQRQANIRKAFLYAKKTGCPACGNC